VGLMVRGHITKLRAVLYVAAQLLASSAACVLLRFLSGGMVRSPSTVPAQIHGSRSAA
jgi:aquaporin TIP